MQFGRLFEDSFKDKQDQRNIRYQWFTSKEEWSDIYLCRLGDALLFVSHFSDSAAGDHGKVGAEVRGVSHWGRPPHTWRDASVWDSNLVAERLVAHDPQVQEVGTHFLLSHSCCICLVARQPAQWPPGLSLQGHLHCWTRPLGLHSTLLPLTRPVTAPKFLRNTIVPSPLCQTHSWYPCCLPSYLFTGKILGQGILALINRIVSSLTLYLISTSSHLSY